MFTNSMTPLTTHATKTAADLHVGEVIVFRPDPTALTYEYRPTIYRRVEKIALSPTQKWASGLGVDVLVHPPHSSGKWIYFDSEDSLEISESVTESCSILPDGRVLK